MIADEVKDVFDDFFDIVDSGAWVTCHDVGVVLVCVRSESVDVQGLGLNAVGHGNGCG